MQVWFKDRRIGEARVPSPHPAQRAIRMQVRDDEHDLPVYSPASKPGDDLTFLDASVREIILPLDVVSFRISDLDIKRNGEGYEHHMLSRFGVSRSECEVTIDHNRFEKVYRYRIIRATLPLLEEIFDMDWFEPADGMPDMEETARRRLSHLHLGSPLAGL